MVLALLLVSIVKGFTSANKPYNKGLYAATMGFAHQIIWSIILYVNNILPSVKGMPFGEIMKNAELRFGSWNARGHDGVGGRDRTIGYSLGKRAQTDAQKHKKTAVFFTIALLMVLFTIPWATTASLKKNYV